MAAETFILEPIRRRRFAKPLDARQPSQSGPMDVPRRVWLVVGSLALVIVGLAHLSPQFIGNETSTLLHIRQLVDTELLHNDWAHRQVRLSADWIFELAFYPLVRSLGSFPAALCGRMIAWSVAIYALLQLARTLRIGPWAFLIGFMFWFYVGQSLVAGEWILGGLDSKTFSYALVLLAICRALNKQFLSCAMLAGLATSLHVLVGGWSSMGLVAACAWRSYQDSGAVIALKQSVRFAGVLILCALPGLVPALSQAPIPNIDAQGTLELLVLVRNPHHLDPHSFLPLPRALVMLAYVGLTYTLIWDRFARPHAQMIGIFLAVTLGIFACGLIAREFGAFWLLVYYPFRTGSLYLPLFFSLAAVPFLGRHLFSSSAAHSKWKQCAALAACYLMVYEASNRDMPERPLKDLAMAVQQWQAYAQHTDEYSSFADVASWIRANSDTQATFICPPWIQEFWLLAERAQVASLKGAPADGRMPEWHRRVVFLLGGANRSRGIEALPKGQAYYQQLPLERILASRRLYDADYYLCQQLRQDLPFPLVYSNSRYYLYKLDGSPP